MRSNYQHHCYPMAVFILINKIIQSSFSGPEGLVHLSSHMWNRAHVKGNSLNTMQELSVCHMGQPKAGEDH